MVEGVGRYAEEVRSRHFPEPDHVYGVEPAELAEFRRYLEQETAWPRRSVLGLGAAALSASQLRIARR